MKAHILIVEDEPVLYERLRRALIKHHFTVDEYTKSYDEAIQRIIKKTPDVVLLDINLQGKKDGIDLGKLLHSKYKIPFIYVTQRGDETSFQQGLHTHHEYYIVKTKPRLNIDDVVRAIQTVIYKKQKNTVFQKEALFGLVSYLDEIKEFGSGQISRVPVKFKDIVYFTNKPFINKSNKTEETKVNYLWFLTREEEQYFVKSSLKDLLKHLPAYFVRINESYIINISPDFLNGRINGARILIKNNPFTINATYLNEVKKRFNTLYSL